MSDDDPVIELCDNNHYFAKFPDHPRRNGLSRCPYCLAQGLDAARDHIERLEKAIEMAESWGKAGIKMMDAETGNLYDSLKA